MDAMDFFLYGLVACATYLVLFLIRNHVAFNIMNSQLEMIHLQCLRRIALGKEDPLRGRWAMADVSKEYTRILWNPMVWTRHQAYGDLSED